jgi:hypothetical protein
VDFTYDRRAERPPGGRERPARPGLRRQRAAPPVVAADPGFDEKTWSRLAEMGLLGPALRRGGRRHGRRPGRGGDRRRGDRPGARARALRRGGRPGRRPVAAVGTDAQRGELLGGIAEGTRSRVRARRAGTRWSRPPRRHRHRGRRRLDADRRQGAGAQRRPRRRARGQRGRRRRHRAVPRPRGRRGPDPHRLPHPRRRPRGQRRVRRHPGRAARHGGGDQTAAIERALAEARIAYAHEAVGAMDTALRRPPST